MIDFIKKFWRWIIGFIIGGVALAGGLQIINTPNKTLEQQILQTIEAAQQDYYQTHNRYFQGLPTSKEIPISTSTPDNLNAKPFYQTENWDDFISLSNLPFQIEIHQYKGPKGDGYQVFFRDSKGIRSYGYGPEAEGKTFEIINPIIIATTTPQ